MGYEPPFLGFLRWSEGINCPCAMSIRRLYVTKLWHHWSRDADGAVLGVSADPNDRNRYLQFTSSDWTRSSINGTWVIDRLTGRTTGPEFDQEEGDAFGSTHNGLPRVTFDGATTILDYPDGGGDFAIRRYIHRSMPYTPALVLADLAEVWANAAESILVVPWGGEGQLARAEVGGYPRWGGPNTNPVFGPPPADGRIVASAYPGGGVFNAKTRVWEVWSEWAFGAVQRMFCQFFHKGFFSLERYDDLFDYRAQIKVVRPYERKYYYMEGGMWEIGAPELAENDVIQWDSGRQFFVIRLGDVPPPGVAYEEVVGKKIASGGC